MNLSQLKKTWEHLATTSFLTGQVKPKQGYQPSRFIRRPFRLTGGAAQSSTRIKPSRDRPGHTTKGLPLR